MMANLGMVRWPAVLALALALPLLGACSSSAPRLRGAIDATDVNGFQIASLHNPQLGASTQLVLVVAAANAPAESRFVRVWMLERFDRHSSWTVVHGPFAGCVGANGFAPPGEKREGDKRTPSGIYTITELFGSDAAFKPRLPYKIATENDAWCEDPTSPHYNQWISGEEAKKANDRLARNDDLYIHAAVIDYNRWPVVPGAGSAIFMHRADPAGAGTLGCVGLEQGPLDTILLRLDPAKTPLIMMGTLDVLKNPTSGFEAPPKPPAMPTPAAAPNAAPAATPPKP